MNDRSNGIANCNENMPANFGGLPSLIKWAWVFHIDDEKRGELS
jgi:hypothetical protein